MWLFFRFTQQTWQGVMSVLSTVTGVRKRRKYEQGKQHHFVHASMKLRVA